MRGAMLLLLAALSLASAAAPPCSYLIKAGDTIYALAQTYGLTVDAITAVNQLSNADVLQPGIVIDLPCSGNATSATSVLDLLANRSDLSTLFRAATAAGFADTLADEALVATVFAPNNTAFERLLERVLSNTTLDELLADGQELEELLAYHVVPGEALPAADLTQGLNLTTALDGEFVQVFKPANITRLSTSTGQYVRVLEADLKAGKSVVHITKGVMVPASSGIVLPQPSASCSHTVVEGDTLFGLATEVGSSVAALVDLNPALEADPTKLALGDEVILSADCEV